MSTQEKLDRFWVGFAPGIIIPILVLIGVYLKTYDNKTVSEFFYFLTRMGALTKLLSLCVVPNLGIFFLFIWNDFMKGARGTLAATFVMAISITILQFSIQLFT